MSLLLQIQLDFMQMGVSGLQKVTQACSCRLSASCSHQADRRKKAGKVERGSDSSGLDFGKPEPQLPTSPSSLTYVDFEALVHQPLGAVRRRFLAQ